MKIGIKLLLAGVFVTFTVLSFAQSNDNGEDRLANARKHMKPLAHHGKINPHKKQVRKVPYQVTPIKSTCPRADFSK